MNMPVMPPNGTSPEPVLIESTMTLDRQAVPELLPVPLDASVALGAAPHDSMITDAPTTEE